MNKVLLIGIIMLFFGLLILFPGIRNANEFLQFQKENYPIALRENLGFKEIIPLGLGVVMIIVGIVLIIIQKRKNY